MVTRIRKLLVLLIIVGISAGIIVLNLEPVTFTYAPGQTVTAVGGVIHLTIFFLGILVAGAFGLAFGIKAYLRERGLQNKERRRQAFYKSMLEARGYLALDDWRKAQDCWESVIKKDPTDIIARVELSRSLEGAGRLQEALKVIDAARAADPTNVEVLFRAADLNLVLGNKTAAIDNLALILYHQPNPKAAALARDLSEELGRVQDAIEYQKRLENLGVSERAKEIHTRLQYQQLSLEADQEGNLLERLRKFQSKHPEFLPATEELARREALDGNVDQAAQLYVQAARVSGERKYWNEAAKLWIENRMVDRAVSAARAATRNTRGLARIRAELDLIYIYLSFDKADEARHSIEQFGSLLKAENVTAPAELLRDFLILKGYCLNLRREFDQATLAWKELSNHEFELQLKLAGVKSQAQLEHTAPSPALSTP